MVLILLLRIVFNCISCLNYLRSSMSMHTPIFLLICRCIEQTTRKVVPGNSFLRKIPQRIWRFQSQQYQETRILTLERSSLMYIFAASHFYYLLGTQVRVKIEAFFQGGWSYFDIFPGKCELLKNCKSREEHLRARARDTRTVCLGGRLPRLLRVLHS